MDKKTRNPKTRIEHDTMGPVRIPYAAYWGAQTQRASLNFRISGTRPHAVFIRSTAMLKLAAARANLRLGLIDKKRAGAISRAAHEIIRGKLHGEFILDAFQAGAGTSHNMNANEVIANRAAELLGGARGDHALIHPNDHVNMSQSTNDVIPTATRIAALISASSLIDAMTGLEKALRAKAVEFDSVIKSGRTHLQDAVPVRLGQEFGGYASGVHSSIERIKGASERIKSVGLGATAAGTGINTHPRYRDTVLKELRAVTGIRGLRKAPDTFEALGSMTELAAFSGALRDAAVELIRISNDLRLLGSGPRTGFAEILLPAVQPGSSIMPGKVNPVMAEMIAMVSFQVIGCDLTVALAAQAGQLELNVMGPVVNRNILFSLEILTNAVTAFTSKCVKGIKADSRRCRYYFEASAGLATALNRIIGYEKAASVAKEAVRSGRTIKEVAIERGVLSAKQWETLFDPMRITSPALIGKARKRG